jgi:hypothetical protein
MQSRNAIKLLVLSALYSAPLYSSDYTYGQTNNAASTGLNWVMSNVLPNTTGLDVNGVIYRYTTVKNPADDMLVHVQNENPIQGGYIFRETDDWSGLPGGSINKLVPVDNIPAKYWGNGSIEVEGTGSVTDPSVIYTYRYLPCANDSCEEVTEVDIPEVPEVEVPEVEVNNEVEAPVSDRAELNHHIETVVRNQIQLPELPEIYAYDVTQDMAVQLATQSTDLSMYEDEKPQKDEKESDDEMESALSAAENAIALADGVTQTSVIQAMNAVSLGSYYAVSIDGGTYNETLKMVDSEISDNKRAFRNLSEQKLHNDMIDMQYGR